jgi:quinol monooxygenase YgiN
MRQSAMPREEFVAIAHVDISPRSSLDEGVELLKGLASAMSANSAIALAVLRQPVRQNHFELFASFPVETEYLGHLGDAPNLHFRRAIAPMLGSPYEDRLHRPRAGVFPIATVGDFISLTQLEFKPAAFERAAALVEDLAAQQRQAAGLREQLVLERRGRPGHFELLSSWESEADFDRSLVERELMAFHEQLVESLVAPVDDRRHLLLAGSFAPR